MGHEGDAVWMMLAGDSPRAVQVRAGFIEGRGRTDIDWRVCSDLFERETTPGLQAVTKAWLKAHGLDRKVEITTDGGPIGTPGRSAELAYLAAIGLLMRKGKVRSAVAAIGDVRRVGDRGSSEPWSEFGVELDVRPEILQQKLAGLAAALPDDRGRVTLLVPARCFTTLAEAVQQSALADRVHVRPVGDLADLDLALDTLTGLRPRWDRRSALPVLLAGAGGLGLGVAAAAVIGVLAKQPAGLSEPTSPNLVGQVEEANAEPPALVPEVEGGLTAPVAPVLAAAVPPPAPRRSPKKPTRKAPSDPPEDPIVAAPADAAPATIAAAPPPDAAPATIAAAPPPDAAPAPSLESSLRTASWTLRERFVQMVSHTDTRRAHFKRSGGAEDENVQKAYFELPSSASELLNFRVTGCEEAGEMIDCDCELANGAVQVVGSLGWKFGIPSEYGRGTCSVGLAWETPLEEWKTSSGTVEDLVSGGFLAITAEVFELGFLVDGLSYSFQGGGTQGPLRVDPAEAGVRVHWLSQ
jgi:hypothetical protein